MTTKPILFHLRLMSYLWIFVLTFVQVDHLFKSWYINHIYIFVIQHRFISCDAPSLFLIFSINVVCCKRFSIEFLKSESSFKWGYLIRIQSSQMHCFKLIPFDFYTAIFPSCCSNNWRIYSLSSVTICFTRLVWIKAITGIMGRFIWRIADMAGT